MSTESRGRERAVPSSRLSRFSRLGGTTTAIAGNMAANGLASLSRGQRPVWRDLLLTPGNITRLTDQLAQMRGAAMKVGQLVSMDAGELLPPELADIMSRLRADADYMPPKQLRSVLDAAWGKAWLRQFKRFDTKPIAAASIGQVHRALTRDGRDLAIKVQYPGVARSIDSDVSNVGALLRMSGLAPAGLDIGPFLDEAKRQLHEEADYEREGAQLARFHALLEGDDGFTVPARHDDLTTRTVLAMDFIKGEPVEAAVTLPQAARDRVMTRLIDLLFRELFAFRLMQTDPNFANYRYDREADRIVLLDFGAAREVSEPLAAQYRRLFRAGIDGSRADLRTGAREIGFISDRTAPRHEEVVLDLMEMAFEALHGPEPFDFGRSDMVERMRERSLTIADDADFADTPPMETLFLQRKFAGMYLLASKLGARVDVRGLLAPYL